MPTLEELLQLPEPATDPGAQFPEFGNSFRDRLAMALSQLPNPGGYGPPGDVFLANLLSGAARGWSGPVVARGAASESYNERSRARATKATEATKAKITTSQDRRVQDLKRESARAGRKPLPPWLATASPEEVAAYAARRGQVSEAGSAGARRGNPPRAATPKTTSAKNAAKTGPTRRWPPRTAADAAAYVQGVRSKADFDRIFDFLQRNPKLWRTEKKDSSGTVMTINPDVERALEDYDKREAAGSIIR